LPGLIEGEGMGGSEEGEGSEGMPGTVEGEEEGEDEMGHGGCWGRGGNKAYFPAGVLGGDTVIIGMTALLLAGLGRRRRW